MIETHTVRKKRAVHETYLAIESHDGFHVEQWRQHGARHHESSEVVYELLAVPRRVGHAIGRCAHLSLITCTETDVMY